MKTIFGMWALLPYLSVDNLFIDDESAVTLQVFEVETTDFEQEAIEIIADSSKTQWYTLVDTTKSENWRLNNRNKF